MAAISAVDATTPLGVFTATKSTLTTADTIVLDTTKVQLATFDNPTGGSITVTLKGDAATTANIQGLGSVSLASGYAITLAAGDRKSVVLKTIALYLTQTALVNVTSTAGGATLTLYNI